jgi:hypothetical protein
MPWRVCGNTTTVVSQVVQRTWPVANTPEP